TETFTVGGVDFTVAGGETVADLIAWINNPANATGAKAELDSEGRLQISARVTEQPLTIGGTAAAIAGISSQTAPAAPETNSDFVNRTVEGGAITVYAPNGASVNVQMRWGKVADEPATWRLYYMSNSQPQTWDQVPDGEFTFEDGVL